MTPTPESPLSDEQLARAKKVATSPDLKITVSDYTYKFWLRSLIAEVQRSRQLRQRLSHEIVRAAASDDRYSDILRALYRVAEAQPHQGGEESE